MESVVGKGASMLTPGSGWPTPTWDADRVFWAGCASPPRTTGWLLRGVAGGASAPGAAGAQLLPGCRRRDAVLEHPIPGNQRLLAQRLAQFVGQQQFGAGVDAG